MIYKGIMLGNIISRGQVLCAVASEVRMSGSRLSITSAVRNKNHRIRVFFTIFAVEEKKKLVPRKTDKISCFIRSDYFFYQSMHNGNRSHQ